MTQDRNAAPAAQLGQGYYWQDLTVGQRFQTFRRTVTETDIVNFISVTGMLETIFIDATYSHGAIKGRPPPGAGRLCFLLLSMLGKFLVGVVVADFSCHMHGATKLGQLRVHVGHHLLIRLLRLSGRADQRERCGECQGWQVDG